MDISGETIITAPRESVWFGLNNAEILKKVIPGCQELNGNFADGFSAKIKQKIGPVSATFAGKVDFSDVVEGGSYRINGAGDGGVAGFAKGYADVNLTEIPEGTLLSYKIHATIGGKIMQLGSRMIEPVVKKCAEEFFQGFNKALSET